MKKTYLLYWLLLGTLGLNAQQYISFTYDAAGNRIKRELIVGAFRKDADTLSDQLGASQFHIYPNPTTAAIQVEMAEKDSPVDREYSLLSLSGTVLFTKSSNASIQSFDLSAQPSGIYLLRIRQKDEEVVWRIVKE